MKEIEKMDTETNLQIFSHIQQKLTIPNAYKVLLVRHPIKVNWDARTLHSQHSSLQITGKSSHILLTISDKSGLLDIQSGVINHKITLADPDFTRRVQDFITNLLKYNELIFEKRSSFEEET